MHGSWQSLSAAKTAGCILANFTLDHESRTSRSIILLQGVAARSRRDKDNRSSTTARIGHAAARRFHAIFTNAASCKMPNLLPVTRGCCCRRLRQHGKGNDAEEVCNGSSRYCTVRGNRPGAGRQPAQIPASLRRRRSEGGVHIPRWNNETISGLSSGTVVPYLLRCVLDVTTADAAHLDGQAPAGMPAGAFAFG